MTIPKRNGRKWHWSNRMYSESPIFDLLTLLLPVMLTRTWGSRPRPRPRTWVSRPRPRPRTWATRPRPRPRTWASRPRPRTWLKSLSQGQGLVDWSLRTGKDQRPRPRTHHRVENFQAVSRKFPGKFPETWKFSTAKFSGKSPEKFGKMRKKLERNIWLDLLFTAMFASKLSKLTTKLGNISHISSFKCLMQYIEKLLGWR